jgi:hypothetical protein
VEKHVRKNAKIGMKKREICFIGNEFLSLKKIDGFVLENEINAPYIVPLAACGAILLAGCFSHDTKYHTFLEQYARNGS